MSLTSEQRLTQYTLTTSGQTLPTVFKFFDASDIKVTKTVAGVDTPLVLTTDYSVTGGGTPCATGSVVMVAGANGDVITIEGNATETQATDLTLNGPFPAPVMTAAVDRLTMLCQQLKNAVDRCIRGPNTGAVVTPWTNATLRVSSLLGFDASGLPTTVNAATLATMIAATTVAANLVAAGPATGSAAYPTYRTLVAADLASAMASPPAIGGTAPSVGAFTGLNCTSFNLVQAAAAIVSVASSTTAGYSEIILGNSFGSGQQLEMGVNGPTYGATFAGLSGNSLAYLLTSAGAPPSALLIGTRTSIPLVFGVNNAEVARITSGGLFVNSNGGFNIATLALVGLRVVAPSAATNQAFCAIENAGVHQINLRPNVSSVNLIQSDFLSGSVYLPLALSGRGNAADFVLGITGNASFGGLVGVGGAAVSSSTALICPAGTTGVSSLRIPQGAAPTSPVNGDIWTTSSGLFVRINSVTVGPLT